MLDLITFKAASNKIKERSALAVRALFQDSAAYAGVQPTNVYYRLDDNGSGVVLLDWTPVTPPVLPNNFVDLVLTAEQNRILYTARQFEQKTLTVMTDRGLATQFVAAWPYQVDNLGWC